MKFVTVYLGCVGVGVAQIRRNELLPSMGILRRNIAAPVFTSPMH